ncbi:MAG TPA: N,N-dimethylformamidase beta subunit family domain-containing protein [Solirubrobacteraceae bacterium]|nr:N,N-dimethylformamidase beta subunit family domain-containing protein [Solirubrobacteraceae bacterium]
MTRFEAWALGYPDELSVRPGESVRFHISGAGAETVQAQLVRLIHGDTQAGGPGFREVEVASAVNGTHPLREQSTHHGSYARIPGAASILAGTVQSGVSLCTMIQPFADTGVQPLVTAWDAAADSGMALVLEPGLRPAFWIAGARVALAEPLLSGTWYAVCGSWDAAKHTLAIRALPVINSYNSRFGPVTRVAPGTAEVNVDEAPAVLDVDLLLGAFDASDARIVRGAYNGKLALPCVYEGALGDGQFAALAASGAQPAVADRLRAWWDLTRSLDTSHVCAGAADAPDGRLVNQPTRAVTAHNWDGSCYEWRHAPELYGAVHFHDDDIDDVGWEPTCELEVPEELASGVYALRLRTGAFEDHTPFFVRAAPGRESPVALVLPTASYMAYANEHLATAAPMGQAIVGHTPALQPLDLLLMEHPELGLSMYELHTDGSGVAFSSRRRPIVNMRPRHRFSFLGTWQFPSDLYLVDWLEARGTPYDVLIDEDLHAEGADALHPYRAVITGSHPEYASEQMLDAYESYVTAGGHVMSMGGNGFYWVISYSAEKPWIMEVRRGENGVRAWQAAPGETSHATTGEKGGIWRNRGRPPQKLFGTGFTSEGYAGSFHYHRLPDGELPEMSWMFEGVAPGEPIGDFGLVGGGAAGQEIDRADVALGTPPHTYLVASAQNQNDSYKVVPEEIDFMFDGVGGTEHPNVRADLTYFEAPGGGAVFATSSIAWSGALSHAGYDNNVSRITANVLDRFINGGDDG